jgi:hypothetical protein
MLMAKAGVLLHAGTLRVRRFDLQSTSDNGGLGDRYIRIV